MGNVSVSAKVIKRMFFCIDYPQLITAKGHFI